MREQFGRSRAWRAFTLVALSIGITGCERQASWKLVRMEDRLPPLAFTMTSARDDRLVTADNYRGKVVVLEFGYTSCPDICPTTLSNLSRVLKDLGDDASAVRVLFVTVDPERDTPGNLKQYVENFAPEVVGLRGTANQLASLARRYRVAYSVKAAPNPADTEVMHTPTLFVFDRLGRIRLLSPKIDDNTGMEHDLRKLISEPSAAVPISRT